MSLCLVHLKPNPSSVAHCELREEGARVRQRFWMEVDTGKRCNKRSQRADGGGVAGLRVFGEGLNEGGRCWGGTYVGEERILRGMGEGLRVSISHPAWIWFKLDWTPTMNPALIAENRMCTKRSVLETKSNDQTTHSDKGHPQALVVPHRPNPPDSRRYTARRLARVGGSKSSLRVERRRGEVTVHAPAIIKRDGRTTLGQAKHFGVRAYHVA